MIRFDNVYKTYNNKAALNQLSFYIDQGEMVFLTGHSGAGKTTLLKLIIQLEKADRGQIFLGKKNITRSSRYTITQLRRQIGIIFQDPHLLHNRTVFENVGLPLIIQGYKAPEIKRRVFAALDKVSLLHKEKNYPTQLSAGEQQRVGIARAIVCKPQIVIADEPTGNLDPKLSAEIMHLFEAFNQVGVTVLIATHDLGLVAQMDHRIMTLDKGELL